MISRIIWGSGLVFLLLGVLAIILALAGFDVVLNGTQSQREGWAIVVAFGFTSLLGGMALAVTGARLIDRNTLNELNKMVDE